MNVEYVRCGRLGNSKDEAFNHAAESGKFCGWMDNTLSEDSMSWKQSFDSFVLIA
jgi:hypothetical protein